MKIQRIQMKVIAKNQDSSQQDNGNGEKKKFNKKEIQCYDCS
jgi:hypothetical protein